MQETFLGYSWNNQGIFLYSIFPEHFLGIFPGIPLEYFTNILGISHGYVPQIFHEHIFGRSVQLLSKINICKNRFENLKRSKHL